MLGAVAAVLVVFAAVMVVPRLVGPRSTDPAGDDRTTQQPTTPGTTGLVSGARSDPGCPVTASGPQFDPRPPRRHAAPSPGPDLTRLRDDLAQIRPALVRLGRPDAARLGLSSGLPAAQVTDQLRVAGLPVRPEVVELYTWSNGVDPAAQYGATFFLSHYLTPMAEAIDSAHGLAAQFPGYLPILDDDGGGSYGVCLTTGAVHELEPEEPGPPPLMWRSVGDMIHLVVTAYARNQTLDDDDGKRSWQVACALGHELYPDIAFWGTRC